MKNDLKKIQNIFLICATLLLILPIAAQAGVPGDSCTNDADCAEGDCSHNLCYCSLPSETPPDKCTPKKASAGYSCTRDVMCFSGKCEGGACTASGPGGLCLHNGHCVGGDCAGGACTCENYVCTLAAAAEAAPAEGAATLEVIKLENPLGGSTGEVSVPKIIGNIVKTILTVVGALALGMFVYGGFTWLTSGGSSEKIKKGKDILMWAVIGLIVIFSSYTLVDFLLRAFGL